MHPDLPHDCTGQATAPGRHDVGRRLRRARQARGLTLQHVVDAADGAFQVATLSAWERGERSITLETLLWLADHYAVALGALLDAGEHPWHGTVVTLSRARLATAAPYWEPLRTLVDTSVGRRIEPPTDRIRIRDQDLEFLATVYDLSVEDLVSRLGTAGLLAE